MQGIDTRQLISTREGIPLSQTGKNAQPPIQFDTKVEINGSGLSKEELEQAIKDGVNTGQMQTARDLNNQGGGSVAE